MIRCNQHVVPIVELKAIHCLSFEREEQVSGSQIVLINRSVDCDKHEVVLNLWWELNESDAVKIVWEFDLIKDPYLLDGLEAHNLTFQWDLILGKDLLQS